jgi:hypothetical protein
MKVLRDERPAKLSFADAGAGEGFAQPLERPVRSEARPATHHRLPGGIIPPKRVRLYFRVAHYLPCLNPSYSVRTGCEAARNDGRNRTPNGPGGPNRA